EATIEQFVNSVTYSQEYIDQLMEAIETVWQQRQQVVINEQEVIERRIVELRAQAMATVAKLKLLSSETAIKYVEEDLMKLEEQIASLTREKEAKQAKQPVSFDIVMKY